jgi:hypothetical protein
VWQEKAAGTWGVRGELVWPRLCSVNACLCSANASSSRGLGTLERQQRLCSVNASSSASQTRFIRKSSSGAAQSHSIGTNSTPLEDGY